jgi:hypothetical protein
VAPLARRGRRAPGRRTAGVVADCGFTSRAALAASAATKVPFIPGFARSTPIEALPERLPGRRRRRLREVGAADLGAGPRATGLRLIALAARTPADRRGPWVYVTSLWSPAPAPPARRRRRRRRVERAIDELLHGHDLDHLVSYRLHPNRVAIGPRLLARNLAPGCQVHAAGQRPARLSEPRAFRVTAVAGLATDVVVDGVIALTPLEPPACRGVICPGRTKRSSMLRDAKRPIDATGPSGCTELTANRKPTAIMAS